MSLTEDREALSRGNVQMPGKNKMLSCIRNRVENDKEDNVRSPYKSMVYKSMGSLVTSSSKDVEKLESVLKRAMRMVRSLENFSKEDELQRIGFSIE